MRTPLSRENTSNREEPRHFATVSGRITVERSNQGIADLIVDVLHVAQTGTVDRLGSACTNFQGVFEINVPLPAVGIFIRRLSAPRWNLQLAVMGRERDGVGRDKRVLFTSEMRKFSGWNEYFRIELSPGVLDSAGISFAVAGRADANTAADAIAVSYEGTEKLLKAAEDVNESKMDMIRTRRELFRNDIRKRLSSELSQVSDKERASDRFVASDIDIEPKYFEAVKTDVRALITKIPDASTGELVGKIRMKGRLLLNEQQKQMLIHPNNQPVVVSENELEEKLGMVLDKPAAIYRNRPEPDPCRPKTHAEACLDQYSSEHTTAEGENVSTEGSTDSNGNIGGNNVSFDKSAAIAKLMGRQSAPEDPFVFGDENSDLESRLTADGVSDALSGVLFKPGPADVPAFYDFHDLQIAFEPVWQEALDERFLNNVERAYDLIVERGGAPALKAVTNITINANLTSGFVNSLINGLSDAGAAADSEVPSAVAAAVYISLEEWQALPAQARSHLLSLATSIGNLRKKLIEALDPENIPNVNWINMADLLKAVHTKDALALRSQIQLHAADAERLVAHARRRLLEREAGQLFMPSHAIIEKLRSERHQGYPFRYFAASAKYRSVNFGIIATYRQQWTPVSYQVGELVSTIPLAPKEVRRFSKKTIVKTSRAQKEIESNLISRRGESEEKTRSEAEIVARAVAKTNFSRSNSGTLNIGDKGTIGGTATSTSNFSRDVEKHSESIKKEFREAILKSAEEYKNERKIEVNTEESAQREISESGEIQNPNDEIPVTFLFYELQRRFRVCEKLHRLQSVVLVAQEVPPASAIDHAWLIRYDWILNRVLLDDSFRPALTYASTTLVSEETVLAEARQALYRQRKLVEELKEDVAERRALTGLRYAALQRQIERTARSAGSGGGLFGGLGDIVGSIPIAGDIVQGGLDLLTGGGGPSEEAQIREGAARDAYDREHREEQELASRLQNAMSTLEAMQRDYGERLGQHLRQLAQCERLMTHITQNILHYMQAIWAYEPDDQRFLRLRNVPVPVFEKNKRQRRYVISPKPERTFVALPVIGVRSHDALMDLDVFNPPETAQDIKTKSLSQVADLNRPLGFKGNYLIFPMLESNPITEFMMDPYVTVAEGQYGLTDPDPLGNMTLEEFSEYVCCLKRRFDQQEETESAHGDDVESTGGNAFDELKPFLRETLKKLLERSLRNNEEVVVPCGSLYIEALAGAHSVMETFKHLHRQIDVKSAQEDARRQALDNIRRAQRIVDDQLEDPDIESKYVFEGNGNATVIPPADSGGGGANP